MQACTSLPSGAPRLDAQELHGIEKTDCISRAGGYSLLADKRSRVTLNVVPLARYTPPSGVDIRNPRSTLAVQFSWKAPSRDHIREHGGIFSLLLIDKPHIVRLGTVRLSCIAACKFCSFCFVALNLNYVNRVRIVPTNGSSAAVSSGQHECKLLDFHYRTCAFHHRFSPLRNYCMNHEIVSPDGHRL